MRKYQLLLPFLFLCISGNAQTFVNHSLESWGIVNVCEKNIPPDYWDNFSNSGIGPDEGNFQYCPSSIPPLASDGKTYARLMAGNPISGEGMSQLLLGFVIGASYTVSFDYAGSNLWGGSDDIKVHIFIDNAEVDTTPTFHSTTATWTRYYLNFIATATVHRLGFRLYTDHYPSGGGSGGVDNFWITQTAGINSILSSAEVNLFPNPFRDQLTVSSNSMTTSEFMLFDLTSRIVADQFFSNSLELNTSDLSKGIYIYELKNQDGIIRFGKLLKD